MLTTIVSVVSFFLGAVALYIHRSYLLRTAFIEGQKASFKEAIALAVERGDVAIYMSPEGNLRSGLLRAQVAHSIELELRAALSDVGR